MIDLQELESLMREYLGTLGTNKVWWDGVECSEREMAESYLLLDRAQVLSPSFLQWLLNRQIK